MQFWRGLLWGILLVLALVLQHSQTVTRVNRLGVVTRVGAALQLIE
jgi:hypothetical protein